tara:strand:+ start:1113 stop:1856 length:744 start_codon:yes stop_codon:yes gene_type:complete
MKKLDCLTKESIEILRQNRLVQPLIKAEYLREVLLNVVLEKSLIEENINDLKLKLGIDSKEKFEEWLYENDFNFEEFKYIAIQNELIKSYAREKFDHQVEAKFLERKSALDIIVYTLIRTSKHNLANEIYLRAKGNEEDIGTLASLYSEGIERKTRGIVGPVPLSTANPRLANQLRKSEVGEVNKPLLIDGLYVITRLEVFDAAQLDDFMREKMREELFNKWLDHEVEIKTANLVARGKEISKINKS